jgi:hypothetical protein
MAAGRPISGEQTGWRGNGGGLHAERWASEGEKPCRPLVNTGVRLIIAVTSEEI